MRIQLWSYNYDPEPTGIGPVSAVAARGLRDRGHEVDVVCAHPHYPEPLWGRPRLPYRERREGIPILRLPLWVGRATARERYRQELSFMVAQFAALPWLAQPDVIVSVSPSFPALLPAMVNARVRGVPWMLWLQDILPDGAASTGLIDSGGLLRAARALERSAYERARVVVVPSRVFIDNLVDKGVPPDKIALVHNPATRSPSGPSTAGDGGRPLRILSMGNIGHSQGLEPLVRAFERSSTVEGRGVELVITGSGVAAADVRTRIESKRVTMPGLVDDRRLEAELRRADVALVSQSHDGAEFNVPSKLMNYMAYMHSLFGVSKAAADLMVQEYGRYFDMPTVCFRGGCLTGPSHAGAQLHGFLSFLMKCTVSGDPYTVFGYEGKQVRDNIHSHDVVTAMEVFHRSPRPAAVYNLGGGRTCACSMREAIAACERISGRELSWSLSETARMGDHRWWISSLSQFETDYPAWSLSYDLEATLREIHDANVERWAA